MIDTVRINFNPSRPLRYPSQQVLERVKADDRWQYRYDRIKVENGFRSCLILIQKHSGLKIGIVGESAVFVETSFPRLVFGYNGWLITRQGQIDEAFSLIEGQVQQWALNPSETGWGCGYEIFRVDLVLQFVVPNVPAAAFIQSMATMSHPSCRTRQKEWTYDGTSNAAYHAGGKLEIKAYDKDLETCRSGGPGNTVRLEMKMEGAVLQRHLGPQAGACPRELNFDECYQCYRTIMLGFRPTHCGGMYLPDSENRSPRDVLMDVFAHAIRVNLVMPDGRTPLDHLRSCKAGKPTIRKTQREIAGRNLAAIRVNWGELFPEQWPPPFLRYSIGQQLQRFSPAARAASLRGDALLG